MNPIELSAQVEERYRRYLKTRFHFRDPEFRRLFAEALDSGHLSNGPFLEGTPVFCRGRAPRDLFPSVLDRVPDAGFLRALEGDRPLYIHQEQAILRTSSGENVIIATGTGSGKTEAFLYPILLHLYREFQANKLGPGVRALILYPMNALANDQRERLGGICRRLHDARSPFSFTFGEYTGETPEDERDTRRNAQARIRARLPGELVLRAEMRDTPPHILLTNFSMLEYLLLRPKDSPLFDDGGARWWTFLILDEAHQYRGSRGIEMAMLIRRLKQRLREGGRAEPFRCIATSATLVGGVEDVPDVAKFASDLFGEPFSDNGVILGETEPIPDASGARLSIEDYRRLDAIIRENSTGAADALCAMAAKLFFRLPEPCDSQSAAFFLLQRDARVLSLRKAITDRPMPFDELAADMFDDVPAENRKSAAVELVELLVRVKNPVSEAPLLSSRYHFFLRSLEGVFVSYWPQKRVSLGRQSAGDDDSAFEVALCRECGQHYLVGRMDSEDRRLRESIRDPNSADFGAQYYRPIDSALDAEGDEDSETADADVVSLCTRCGRMDMNDPGCGHDAVIRLVKEPSRANADEADKIERCGACGYQATDAVREVVYGADGPHAVIATTLYRNLPSDRRKVLAFADSRQEAAYFAWYLGKTYRDILSRNLTFEAARRLSPEAPGGLSLGDLANGLCDLYRMRAIYPENKTDLQLKREAWTALYREFVTDEPRISLEGTGLIRWFFSWPPWLSIPELLFRHPWSFSENEAKALVAYLIDSMRKDAAVELRCANALSLAWQDLDLRSMQMCIRVGLPGGQKSVRSWDNEKGRRARFLAAILQARGISAAEATEHAVAALREVWSELQQGDQRASRLDDRVLFNANDACRINPDWWRAQPLDQNATIFSCSTCGRLQTASIAGKCPRPRCTGALEEKRVGDLPSNHYRSLYADELPPGVLRAEEHTAQLGSEKAQEFQREFKEGKIHVLSSSTTFELGVDLGDLDTVFLRDVPPEAFNYAQRIGRAGRRGQPGFAITYCRRTPHDLYHFNEPERVMRGKTRPPVISLCNERIIRRHVAAVALSRYFREYPERFAKVETLLQDSVRPTCASDVHRFLAEARANLEASLHDIVPGEIADRVGLTDGTWIDDVSGSDSALACAETAISADLVAVQRVQEDAVGREDFGSAKWAQSRVRTILGEDVLQFLSRTAVIPKYGFPVDVVELDTQKTQQNYEASTISLQRDLRVAIMEFAPTSELIANKKVWKSYGLKRVPEREWPSWWYARCPVHNRIARIPWNREARAPSLDRCCDAMGTVGRYIDPQFGFITDRSGPQEPKRRPDRVFSTRPYFAGFTGESHGLDRIGPVTLRRASPGLLVVLCEGRRGAGFLVCGQCGAGFRDIQGHVREHKDPFGRTCRGKLSRVALGHEFGTDVMEIQFDARGANQSDPTWLALGVAYALVEGAAEVLEVPSTDLAATVTMGSGNSSLPPIMIYDNVPGGAGLVARLENRDILTETIQAAYRRVSGTCGCREDTSCYGCLRNYGNQFAHPSLKRGPVRNYLGRVLETWAS